MLMAPENRNARSDLCSRRTRPFHLKPSNTRMARQTVFGSDLTTRVSCRGRSYWFWSGTEIHFQGDRKRWERAWPRIRIARFSIARNVRRIFVNVAVTPASEEKPVTPFFLCL